MNEEMNDYFNSMVHNGQWSADYTLGQIKAYQVWERSFGGSRKSSELECSDLPEEYEIPNFIKTLRDSGAKTLAVTDASTALMRGIHHLISAGCSIAGPCTVSRTVSRFGVEDTLKLKGIRFTLN